MGKQKSTYLFLAFLILFIVFASFIRIVEPFFEKTVKEDYVETINIDNKELSINYGDTNELDISITFGNIDIQEIKITNNNSEDVVYAVKYMNADMSTDEVIYDLFISYDGKEFIQAIKSKPLVKEAYLIYNLVIPKNSTNIIKVVFKSLHENEPTNIKGNLKITNNLTTLELFNMSSNYLKDAIDDKITKLNGITKSGYYYVDISELSFTNDSLLKGYVIIDAKDISDIKYIYTIYNDKYMITNSDKLNDVVNIDNNYVSSINPNKVCNQYNSRATCSNLFSLPKNQIDERKTFYNNSKKIINIVNDIYENNDGKTIIYNITKDIPNETNLVGYILKNNNDMFIYIHNDLFMISGYNYNKLGEYEYKSKTIRAYNETAFNTSAIDTQRVCSFSQYQECYDVNNNRIGSGY